MQTRSAGIPQQLPREVVVADGGVARPDAEVGGGELERIAAWPWSK